MVQYILQQSNCIVQQCLKQRQSFSGMHQAGVDLRFGKTVNNLIILNCWSQSFTVCLGVWGQCI